MLYELQWVIDVIWIALSQQNKAHTGLYKFQIMEQPKILVAIRKRPLSKKEQSRGQTDTVTVKNQDTVIVSEYKQKVDLTKYLEQTIFNFDFAFDQHTNNEQIYEQAVRPLVDSAFQGAKVTCFAYGQTGSGKTFTMNGVINQGIPGLYTLGANDIFDYLASPHFKHLKARLSFYEIYCGKLYDLLNKRNELKLREDNKNNINIIGLEEAPVSSSQQFFEYLLQGSKERVTSMNSANADSSRSHAILQISLKDGKKLFGKISFIDLAGNERGADHMDMGKQTRIDGAQINKSLLSLKECIRALDQGKGHTPFRGSKLTMVLKDSFIGFCRTVMIGNVSPSSASSQNTLNTLRYADRVKQLRKPQDSISKQEVKARQMMLPRQNKNAIRIMINNDDDADDIAEKRGKAQKEYGLVEEPAQKKLTTKQQLTGRKNSFNAGKIQLKPETKSSSVTKNHIGNSLGHKNPMTNNLVGQPPALLNNKGQNLGGNKRPIGMDSHQDNNRDVASTGMHRYNSSQYGAINRRPEPMDIQSETPYYLPQNKSNSHQNPNQKFFSNQPQPQQPNRMYNQPSNMSHSQNMSQNMNISNNYSGVMNNSNVSTGRHPQGMGNYQPGYGHPQPQQQYVQQHQHMNPRHQPQYEIPQNWEDMAATVANSQDEEYNAQILTQMNQKLFSEQEELIRNHSDALRRQIDIIRGQMSQLNQMEVDRSKITSRGYVQFMQEGIEQKISLLEELRERLISFTYKLDTIEEMERFGNKGHIDDEQLLDDINY